MWDGVQSPNLDYPQEIKITTGNNIIKKSNENGIIEQYQLDLGNIELCKIGNTQDFIFKNTIDSINYNNTLIENGWYKYNAIGKVSGSSSFTSNGEDSNRVGLVTKALNIEANLDDLSQITYCNLLTTTQKNYSGLNGTTASNKIRVYISKNYTSTYSEAKQLLTNIIIYFVQLTPTYTQITDSTLVSQLEALNNIQTYRGINHIWCDTNNLEPYLQLTYKSLN